jgi:hypothetical protein
MTRLPNSLSVSLWGVGLCWVGVATAYLADSETVPVGSLLVSLDHDDFGSNRSKIINVIDSNILERDAGGKPLHTFPHPALVVLQLVPLALIGALGGAAARTSIRSKTLGGRQKH